MTRGVPHRTELKVEVLAAVRAGLTIADAARRFGLSKQTVSDWLNELDEDRTLRTRQRARDPETIAELLYDLVDEHVQALRLQLQAASRAEWLAKQSAAELAQLVVAERDTLIRVLAGFRPVEPEPELPQLDAPGAPGAPNG